MKNPARPPAHPAVRPAAAPRAAARAWRLVALASASWIASLGPAGCTADSSNGSPDATSGSVDTALDAHDPDASVDAGVGMDVGVPRADSEPGGDALVDGTGPALDDSAGPGPADVDPGDADTAPDVPTGPPAETGPGLGIDFDSAPGATPRWDLGSSDWTAVGWPNDRLMIGGTHPNLLAFPNPDIDLLTDYLTHGTEVLDGWGLNGSVYFQFDGTIDLTSLPAPQDASDPLAVVQLINVTAGSPRYGRSVPLEFRWYEEGGDAYYLPRTLAMRPVFGMGLTEGETWCALVTRGVRDTGGSWLQAAPDFAAQLLEDPTLAPLVAWLTDTSPLHRTDVAVATCFTTQHATSELRAVEAFIASQDAPELAWVSEPSVYNELHGAYVAPNFQAGSKPYEVDGDLRFTDDGVPIVQLEEELRFMLIAPTHGEMPPTGWPVVLYAHGTGGDYQSCRGVADALLAEGLALLCIDQPLHGTRGPDSGPLSDSELVSYSFNFLNPRAGRMSFRQSAIDTLTLSHMVASGRFDLAPSETISGAGLALDPERIFFFGHSHGGLSGALIFGIDPRIAGGLISGAGGGLINTILLRKDPVDIKALVQVALGIQAADLDSFHPVLSLVQMLVDATDPVNYSRYWLEPEGDPAAAKHVLVTEGTADHATPGLTTETLTATGNLPLIAPRSNSSLAHDLRGLAPIDMPVTENAMTADGPRTAASKQWAGASHFVAFDSPQARAMWLTLFRTMRDGGPVTIDTGDAPLYAGLSVAAGDSCADAGVIAPGSLPALLVGNTSTAADDHHVTGCEGGNDAGESRRDVAYAFTPSVSGTYRFGLYRPVPEDKDDGLPTGPDRLYVVSDCADVAGSCVQQMSGSTLYIALEADTPYFIIVDGGSLAAKGPYELEVSLDCEQLACDGRECGSWGCGSCGTCEAGEICSPEGLCGAAAPGDLCGDALPVDAVPFEASGDTLGHGNAYAFGGSDCPGTGTGRGAASPEVVYRWDVTEGGTYTVGLGSDYDAALYAVTDCADIGGSCLGAQRAWQAPERLVVDVEVGQTVFLIVDGAGNNGASRGAYTLRIDPCVPQCEGRVCGADSCGGSCGECGDGHVCMEEETCLPIPFLCSATAVCEPLLTGDECADPLVVGSLPYSHQATSKDYFDDYGHGGSACPGDGSSRGAASRDVVYAFSAPDAGIYRFGVAANWDSVLYIAEDCADIDGTCLGGDQVGNKGGEELFVTLAAGQEVLAFVDGASNSSDKSGAYTFSVAACMPDCADRVCGSDGCGGSCGSCTSSESCSSGQCALKKGHTCDAPIVVNKSSYDSSADTGDFDAAFSNPCSDAVDDGAAAQDVIYRLKPASDATWRVGISGAWGVQAYLLSECGGEAASCLGQASPGAELEVPLSAGVTYWIVVDGLGDASGSYTLTVDEVCVPDCDGKGCGGDGCGGSCGACAAPADLCQADQTCLAPSDLPGNTCASAFEIDTTSLPFAGEGDTSTGALNHYGFGDGDCPGWVGMGQGSADQVWRLQAPVAGVYTVEVRATGFDVILYAVSDCADIAGTCLAASDSRGDEVLELPLGAGETVFLLIDGTDNRDDASGPYQISVSTND